MALSVAAERPRLDYEATRMALTSPAGKGVYHPKKGDYRCLFPCPDSTTLSPD